jgi:hypothetical protein
MKVFVVTHKKLNKYRNGIYKNLYCYQMDFWEYRECKERGYVFSDGKQALEFMIKTANMYGVN